MAKNVRNLFLSCLSENSRIFIGVLIDCISLEGIVLYICFKFVPVWVILSRRHVFKQRGSEENEWKRRVNQGRKEDEKEE